MPLHEYKCLNCQEEFSIVGTFSSFVGLVPTCPTCKSKDIHKKIFPANIIFKGKGFTKKVQEQKNGV